MIGDTKYKLFINLKTIFNLQTATYFQGNSRALATKIFQSEMNESLRRENKKESG